MSFKLMIVAGTRPELVKMAPVLREAVRRKVPFSFVHTGQHYSPNMDAVFFKDLDLPQPTHHLHVGSGKPGQQTAKMLEGIEALIESEKPAAVLVQGDTNSVLAAVLAASKLRVPIGHIEAGLRSRDWRQPEEKNRIVADHLSDWLFAPTVATAQNLLDEGLPPERIWLSGNTVVDAVLQNVEIARKKSTLLSRLGIEKGQYLLSTAHREEYVDREASLRGIVDGLKQVSAHFNLPVLWSVHPRTQKRLDEFGIVLPSQIRKVGPWGYLDFLQLESNARLVLTDSGGVQEESCILGVPCVVLREYSDRPESIEVGAARLAGTEPEKILAAAKKMDAAPRGWTQPFGDGHAAEKILDAIARPTNFTTNRSVVLDSKP